MNLGLKGLRVRVLVDSWYMRRVFIQSMQARGFDVIGQVRIDTRLYDEPKKKKKRSRGRPRKYGEKYTPKRISHLKKTETTLPLYGKEQDLRYRSKIVKVRFLNGQLMRAVWCELKSESGRWKKARLFLCTDTSLSAEQVIRSYGLRWSIETMFNQLKLSWGLNLEKSVESRKYAQLLDSYSYMKKVLITNKVTSHFFITLSKSITCTSFSRPTD